MRAGGTLCDLHRFDRGVALRRPGGRLCCRVGFAPNWVRS